MQRKDYDRRLFVSAAAALPAVALVGCAPPARDNTLTLHIKVTAHASVNGSPKKGASVLLARVRRNERSAIGMAMSVKTQGEATILDLGDGRTAYFLLKDYVPDILTSLGIRLPVDEEDFAKLRAVSGVIEVPRDRYPQIAAFRDEAEPASVYEVEPDDFASAFGPGVKLTGLTLEVVDEPMTEVIQQRLAWLNAEIGGKLEAVPGGRIAVKDATFGQLLHHSDFLNIKG